MNNGSDNALSAVPAWPILLLLLLLATGSCNRRQPPPNIVLITIDTLRTDRVGACGSESELTPRLDQLAGESAVFLNAVSPIGTTTPAHASIFTGLYPRVHGVRRNGHRLANRHETLAERLQKAGYDTAAFVAAPEMLRGANLKQGIVSHNRFSREIWETRPGSVVNRETIQWLGRAGSRPFYLWLHYFEVHAPYRLTPHTEQHLRDMNRTLAQEISVQKFFSYGKPGGLPPTDENRRYLSTYYDGEVLEVDSLTGEIIDTLIRLEHYDNTVIIVTADHGQHLGEHDRVGHGFSIWEEALRVPLIVRDPQSRTSPRSDLRVGLIDLFPTILDYAGLTPPEETPGRSLVQDIRGNSGPVTPYFGESRIGRDGKDPVAVMSGKRKLVLSADGVMAFDLEADPGETEPLPLPLPTEYAELLELARQHRDLGREAPRPKPVDADTLNRLKNLGYVE